MQRDRFEMQMEVQCECFEMQMAVEVNGREKCWYDPLNGGDELLLEGKQSGSCRNLGRWYRWVSRRGGSNVSCTNLWIIFSIAGMQHGRRSGVRVQVAVEVHSRNDVLQCR
jgi:hypothetical protein